MPQTAQPLIKYATNDLKDERELEEYYSINVGLMSFEEHKVAFSTEAEIGIKTTKSIEDTIEVKSAEAVETNNIIKEVEGVIVDIQEGYVSVKLLPDTIANFPEILFQDKGTIKLGQNIKYQLKIDKEEYRYQEIIPVFDKEPHKDRDFILNLTNEFKYKK